MSGFMNLTGEIPESGPANATPDDLAILVRYQPYAKLALFNETAFDDAVLVEDGRGVHTGHDVVSLQRLYLEVAPTPSLTIRAGKLLTPFGLYNLIRRAPLTWTVERPVSTEQAFPVHTTGMSVAYQTTKSGWTLDATAYGQAQDELVRRSDEKSSSAMGGGRFAAAHSVGSAFVSAGLNAATFDDRDSKHWETAVGLDTEITISSHLVMAEGNYVVRNGPDGWGLYVQDVAPLVGDLYSVLRYEHFDFEADATNGWLIGLAWRFKPQVVFKLDYQFTDRNTDQLNSGLQGALSLSF